ncbi:zinc finger protein RING-type protein [Fadolivirus algeromassiliense]|jgi:hypothetical protein|uniref:Zinc finger protein RING-type protein n=1 Tax=Fadolivirus FV1/VV64 TaxID=3070911 RepID=A0A7D3UVI0_9VIRU|nr:zinc finger protein RING-type protein [Fadolivirus algeromassiliense]QKF94189.1 zinc finger protein RING-type protein [Fadolivirus FV1/VV64]
MNILKYKIDNLYSQYKNYIIIPDRKKTNRFTIQDGYIRYVITFLENGIKCQCDKSMCTHILCLLHKHFMLSCFSIYYLGFTRYQRQLLNDISKGNDFIEDEIYKIITETECGICYNNLSLKDVYVCENCCNMVHDTCMRKWVIAQKNNKKCIYCNL